MTEDQALERVRTRQLAKLGALFAGFAHEIRNPLSTIGLNLQLVKEEVGGDSEEPRDKRMLRRLTVVEGEVKRLQGIVEEFLGFVRVPKLELVTTRLDEMVRELVEFTTPEVEEGGVSIRSFIEDGRCAPLDVDPAQIRAVLVNLVRNAAAAMPGGGQIMIAVRDGAEHVTLQVTDTGEGMTEEVRANAFQPYFSTKKAGTGLGLPTSRRIIEQHGGSIDLASEVGKGTQFTIVLPRRRALEGDGAEESVDGTADDRATESES